MPHSILMMIIAGAAECGIVGIIWIAVKKRGLIQDRWVVEA